MSQFLFSVLFYLAQKEATSERQDRRMKLKKKKKKKVVCGVDFTGATNAHNSLNDHQWLLF
jgi:hypothetical protein